MTAGALETTIPRPLSNRERLAQLLRVKTAAPVENHSLSHGQQALWFLAQLSPNSFAYNLPFIFPVEHDVRVDILEQALNLVVRQHPSLRARFEGDPVQQIVVPLLKLSIREENVRALSTSRLRARFRELNREPFDLARGPLLRATVLRRDSEPDLLLLSVHHIIFDAVSAKVVIEQWLGAYFALKNGRAAVFSTPVARFSDFVLWQKQLLEGQEGVESRSYWLAELAGELPTLDLPSDHPRPAVQSHNGDSWRFDIDPECARKLRALAQEQEATLYMVLLSAFVTLLHRYSGQEDIIVGSPVMGRTEPDFERVVGYFINVVPIRAKLSGNSPFSELLRHVRQKVYGAIQHQDYPFPMLVQGLKAARDPSRSPIFQAAFTLENWIKNHETTENSSGSIHSPSLQPFEWLHQEGEFDLTLDIFDLGGPLRAAFRFNPDLFERLTIFRMAEHFRAILESVVEAPAKRLEEIPLLGTLERQRLVGEWNRTARVFPRDQCFHDLFAQQADRTPERVAVSCGADSLTYAELDRQSSELASRLSERGVGRNTRAGICLDRGVNMLVAALAVLKTGAAYVPLDPAFPAERLAFMAEDAQLRLILTQQPHAKLFAAQSSECFMVGESNSAGAAHSRIERSLASDTAYIIYTSGSTGKPKGVQISHRSLVNFLCSMADEPGLSPDDVLLAVSTLSFDIAGLELYLPLIKGAQVVIARQEECIDARRLLGLMKASRATVMQATPATWQMLLESGWDEGLSLRILCGGEALSRPLANRLLALGSEVWNLFGPTETTIWSTAARVDAGNGPVSLGRPIANTQVFVLDEGKQPVPIGVPGELYIGGEGVALGYWNRTELTAEKFVRNPFDPSGATRLYRTGDLAKFQKDGTLLFLGRLDHQVKLRGFRIELGEIETALQRHFSVSQAVVAVRGDQLVAYIVPKANAAISPGDLRAFLRRSLPDYMTPAVFVELERLPLTPNGKVDRKNLPAPDRSRSQTPEHAAPSGAIEKELGAIWTEALKLEKVSVHENFFELGGHSLLATQVVRRTRELYDIELLDLFTYPTISSLARFIAGRQPAAPQPFLPPAVARDGIAIIGMAGRFPGAANVQEFWTNLKGGVESISFFETEEILASGVDPQLVKRPNYVKAGGVLADADLFDPAFFGYNQAHARLLDPQQRVLLECAWQTLEDAGCDPKCFPGRIGVFAGVGANTYHQPDLRAISETSSAALASLAFTSSDKDFAATRVSYKLGLTGPSLAVQTACSSSLVAVHLACQSLMGGDCEAALAGGVSIVFPQNAGYLHQKDMILSPDGHCRAFDEKGEGTIFSNGLALVLLKPLAKAIADRDQIYAVIRASAINNDGTLKVDFMAPSVQGQSEAIRLALDRAGVPADSIGYVEAHGTGTAVGDPIEVRALADVFKSGENRPAVCALGSVKTNVGHLNTAAGIAGLIKTALCLRDKVLVPSLHFQKPNAHIDFARTPFYVNTKLAPWQANGHPRRAGVSSFGIGGTNAHAILEEPPPAGDKKDIHAWRLLPISAKTPAALEATARNLAAHLRQNENLSLADISFTLQTGRQAFPWRAFVVCSNATNAIEELEKPIHSQQPSSEPADAAAASLIEADKTTSEYAEKLRSLGALWQGGHRVDWHALFDREQPQKVSLPGHPLDRQRYWLETLGPKPTEAWAFEVSGNACRTHFSGEEFYFRDHVIAGEKILPGAVLLELARAAAQARSSPSRPTRLRQIFFRQPIIANGRRHDIEVNFESRLEVQEFQILSSQNRERILHVQGKVGLEPASQADSLNLSAIQQRCPVIYPGRDLYSLMRKYGMDYGPGLSAVEEVRLNATELLARLRVPSESWLAPASFWLHPALVDGAFQTIALLVKEEAEAENTPYLPFSLGELQMLQPLPRECWVHVLQNKASSSAVKTVRTFDITIADSAGKPAAHFRDYAIKFFPRSRIPRAQFSADSAPALLYAPAWENTPVQPAGLPNAQRLLLVGEEGRVSGLGRNVQMVRWGSGESSGFVPDHILFLGADSEISAPGDLQLLFQIGQRFLARKDSPIRFMYCAPGSPTVSAVAAFGRSLLHESGGIDFRAVRAPDRHSIADIVAMEWSQPPGPLEIEWRAGERFVRKIVPVTLDPSGAEQVPFKNGGTYLITGGLGGIGRLLARFLSEQFRARLILIGRQPPDDPMRAFLSGMDALYLAADVADETSLREALDLSRDRFGALHGIFHCAGVLEDGFLAGKSGESFSRVLRPKVEGTLLLDKLTRSEPLDFFALFSSISAIIGTPGQCDYAAANGFMDGFAELRESWRKSGQRFGVTLSLNWGLWQDGGMHLRREMEEQLRKRTGLEPLFTKAALNALGFAIAANRSRLIPVQGSASKIESLFSTAKPAAKPSVVPASSQPIEVALQERVALLLGVQPGAVSTEKDMGEFGLDSVLVIDLITGLNTLYSLDLSPSIFFEQKTLGDLAKFIASQKPELLKSPASVLDEGSAAASPGRAAAPYSRATDPIAVVGMAGVFPQSPDLEAFWENLISGRDLITEVPADRWDWREYFGDPRKEPRKMNIKWGAFLSEIDKFDARLFNLPPREAELMDPQHRLLLQTVWKALDDAGHPPNSLSGSSTGVFVGICSADYQELMLRTVSDVDIRAGSGTAMDIIPSRISFLLNLHGPSEISATACSSSLVALHRAVQAIQHGECEQAIAGGVNLMITPTLYLCYGKAGMLAPDGQCKTFDHRANGYVRGEGAAAVLLKPLQRALADGDHIYGLIKGTAVNHAGHTRTFGAPSPQAEAEVIRKALERSGVSPASVSYIEAHGTGTPLGDPIEISGLDKAFREVSAARGEKLLAGYCPIASVKTNVGHMEAAAGIAGLVKVLLALRHKKLPASRNFEKLNPYIKLEGTPFYILDRTIPWEPIRDTNGVPLPRRAGISSFGFGGAYAHVVVEEFAEAPAGLSMRQKPELLVLSARSIAQLREYAELTAKWLENEFPGRRNGRPEPNFANAAYTLQVGRDPMPERLAIIAETPADAAAQIRAWLQGKTSGTLSYNKVSARRQPREEKPLDYFQTLYRQDDLAQLATLWTSGEDLPWEQIRAQDLGARISLPTCPFARDRYWLASEAVTPVETPPPASAVDSILDQLRNHRLTVEDATALLQALPENGARIR